MTNQPICSSCGCALSAGDAVCPLCGTPVSAVGLTVAPAAPFKAASFAAPQPFSSAASEVPPLQSSQMPYMSPIRSRRRKPLVIGVALAGVLVVACVSIGIGIAWNSDAELKERAENTTGGEAGLVEQRPVFERGMGSTAGNLAGGGIVVPDGDAQYMAEGNGIYYLETVSAEESTYVSGISTDCASCLNLYDNALYYLASSGNANMEPGVGTSIRKIADPLKSLGSARSSEVLYRSESGAKLGGLAVRDGWMYFAVQDGQGCAVMEMSCDASNAPRELKRIDADRCWVFVESDGLYFVTANASSWNVDRCNLDQGETTFVSFMKGEGRLTAACLSGGSFYYAVDGAEDPLRMKDAQGGFKEYPEVVGAVRIVALGEVVAAVTDKGSLLWVDSSTGFAHDVSLLVQEGLAGGHPGSLGLGLYDEWLCVRDNKANYVQLNVNNGEIWAGGDAAGDLVEHTHEIWEEKQIAV